MIEVYAVGFIIGLVMIFYIIRRELKPKYLRKNRGTEPGEGYSLTHSNISMKDSGHGGAWNIPKNPQEYSRLFALKTDKKGK